METADCRHVSLVLYGGVRVDSTDSRQVSLVLYRRVRVETANLKKVSFVLNDYQGVRVESYERLSFETVNVRNFRLVYASKVGNGNTKWEINSGRKLHRGNWGRGRGKKWFEKRKGDEEEGRRSGLISGRGMRKRFEKWFEKWKEGDEEDGRRSGLRSGRGMRKRERFLGG